MSKMIHVTEAGSDFEREPLVRPFGFKGNYLTELWQVAVRLQSTPGLGGTGLATQSVLYGDAELFAAHPEAGGNALLYVLTNKALELIKSTPFRTPPELLETILPPLTAAAAQLTGRTVNPNFILNAMVAPDNAAWLLYAAENGFTSFDEMLPDTFRPALRHRNDLIAILYQVSYNMPVADIVQAAKEGFFVFKIKTGHPGRQEDMLRLDMERLSAIHAALKDLRTPHTADGKLVYTMDANSRYEKKETLLRYLDHARKIGAFGQVLLYEEPLTETNTEYVDDAGVRIAADDSLHTVHDAQMRLEQGYGALVLKGIAKTLSLSLPMAKLADERNVPCMCSDLTVNPILVNWHKNLAARLAPFPGIGMGLMETNGDANYSNWPVMKGYAPYWSAPQQGVFHLDEEFYRRSGGIFEPVAHYEKMFRKH
ncbi:L-alanine-DL-glutamate epimerase [Chitinophaga lutea]|uniref:L-alanine-DL-glutamate epimerase n=1 Tax=Chitinophaga lutea TaxID=2488634 RepID=A0A3N4Q1A2_9BACT|nr:enolase C-terminal domain-like protein [Chitinophaga lutea]RPE12959.1 L-alanine-DL-glutamate epimerase [Chitinophaga lutea]